MIDKIILHVGAEKTGSTSLQRILSGNPAWLRDAKAHYPIHPLYQGIRANAKLLTFALQQEFPKAFKRNFPNKDVATLDPVAELNVLLDQCPEGTKTAVLSSELLHPHHASELKKLMPKGVGFHVVLVVRRQDNWLHSYFSQCLKSGQNITLDDLVESILTPTTHGFSCPDWAWQHQIWQREFETCSVIFYDDPLRTYQTAFFDLIDAKPDKSTRTVEKLNLGLSASAMAYLSNLDSHLPDDVFMQHVKACRDCVKSGASKDRRSSILSPQHRQKLIARFAAGNQKLAQTFNVHPDFLSIPAQDQSFIPLDAQRQTAAYHQFQTDVHARLSTFNLARAQDD